MQKYTLPWLAVIAAIALLCIYMLLPNPGLFGRPIETRLGLDIQGGLRVLMSADDVNVTAEQMAEARRVIERRVNALGVAEAAVQVAGTNRMIVELPGVQDPQKAIDIIQQTALLEFVDFSAIGGCTAQMPPAGTFILTDRQVQLGRGLTGVTPTATAEATAAVTAAATAEATAAATTPATAAATAATTAEATAVPTTAATTAATSENTAQPTTVSTTEAAVTATAAATESAASPTTEATAVPTATATSEATAASTAAATNEPTAAATAEPTASATAETTAAPTAEATPVPSDVPGTPNNRATNPCTGQPFNTIMTGAALKAAEPRVGGQAQNQYVVYFQLDTGNPEAKNFGSFTGANIGQPMAIVLDGEVLSAPEIQAQLDSEGIIQGNFTLEEARTLGLQLRSGALPVSLTIVSREQVGASLGAESVNDSVRAGVVGLIAVFLFLILYYRVGGLAASLALILFGMMNFALYKYIPVTLTLSAITGFLISIGSAVDGNILIFERIKEELRGGRQLNRALELGFSRAWVTIRDSNVSTIMIAAILYFFGGQFGASAVRGFAVTLILGLVFNLFTAVIVTRVFLNVLLSLLGERAKTMNLFGQ
ncbi:MAG TPA: protein translocase subunit SecD [Aggregatilineales bacterium]|nr:protein translocase subunit SecD [Anaerolineales bacterium]HRE46669.1 protein translocase subunit SecD [Aggregatilineales bacterium]